MCSRRETCIDRGRSAALLLVTCLVWCTAALGTEPQQLPDNVAPPGLVALFNGHDLAGWKGLVADPPQRAKLSADALAQAQEQADVRMRAHWQIQDGTLVFDGAGENLCTVQDYADFELLVDWKIEPGGDSGIYLRGSPQVQIWDNPEGSGGLWNNQTHAAKPLIVADRPPGQWNTFRIIMVGERVTVYLNDLLVVDDTVLENYWERDKAIYARGPIELQNHNSPLYFKNIYIRELRHGADVNPAALPILKRGDCVAIVGDSITEQKLYSRYIEDYLLACVPQLELRVVQLGWSGERAPGFADRLENDLLPLRPNVVTTCYGMNDGLYRAYEPKIGQDYDRAMRQIVERLKTAGAKVVIGSPGAVDFDTFRRSDCPAAVYNDNLAHLRDIDRELAREQDMPFADVHDQMILAMHRAKPVLGAGYHVCGGDGFHPASNGHIVMAYAFLKALALDGRIGTITVDFAGAKSDPAVTATEGHRILSAPIATDAASGSVIEIESTRYPFCFYGDPKLPEGTRSITPYVPFNADLNRLVLVVKNLPAPAAVVTWGQSKRFTKAALQAGVNLAAEFAENPFSEPFHKLDELVAQKQQFETQMVKECFASYRRFRALAESDEQSEAAIAQLQAQLLAAHARWQAKVRAAVTPVRHTLTIKPAE